MSACNRNCCGRRIILIRYERLSGRCRHKIVCSTRQSDQLRYLPPIKRKFENSILIDDLPDPGAVCFHLSRIGLDLNRLCNRAYRKHDGDCGIAVHLQHDARLDVGAEAWQRSLKTVWADRQIRKNVCAGLIRHSASAVPRFCMCNFNVNARQQRTGLIFDCSVDLRDRCGLRREIHADGETNA